MSAPVKSSPRGRVSSSGHDALIAAASYLLAERGYKDTSVSEIASRAGMSVGSVYNFAPSKSALLLDVYHAYHRRQSERVADAIAASRAAGVDDPAILFVAGTHGYLTGVWRERALSRVLTTLDSRDIDLEVLGTMQGSWLERNARLLGLDDETPRSRALSATFMGAVGGWVRDVQQCETEEGAVEYIEAALGLLKKILHATDIPEKPSASSPRQRAAPSSH